MSMVFGAISRILAVCCVISMMGMAATTATADWIPIPFGCSYNSETRICDGGGCPILTPGTCQTLPAQDPGDPSGQSLICCYVH